MQDELGGEKRAVLVCSRGPKRHKLQGLALCVDILKKDSATLSGESCDYTFSVI